MSNGNTAIWSNIVPLAAKAVSSAEPVIQGLIELAIKNNYNCYEMKKEIVNAASEEIDRFFSLLEAIEKNETERMNLLLNNEFLSPEEKAELFRLCAELREQKDIRRTNLITKSMTCVVGIAGIAGATCVGTEAVRQIAEVMKTIARTDAVKSFALSAVVTAIKH